MTVDLFHIWYKNIKKRGETDSVPLSFNNNDHQPINYNLQADLHPLENFSLRPKICKEQYKNHRKQMDF